MPPGPLLWLLALGLLLPAAPASAQPVVECLATKLRASGLLAKQLFTLEGRALARGEAVSAERLAAARERFARRFASAEAAGGCPRAGDAAVVEAELERVLVATRAALLPDPPVLGGERCAARKLRSAGQRASAVLGGHGRRLSSGAAGLARAMASADRAFAAAFARAEARGGCRTVGDELAIRDLLDTGADFAMGFLRLVDLETLRVPSAARPAHTPGTAGVDVSAYPKLVAQFGGTDVDLHQALYTRHFYQPGTAEPDAILILVPGFEGGAGSFHVLAQNLVTRAREAGFGLEVWAFDRRSHQLEDLAGLEIAEASLDARVALDWMFGAALGLPLHPVLAVGPRRRIVFHDSHADTAFLANWTDLVISRDIDAVVERARAAARNANVFLGGHSAGTGFAARYAATDFDLSGGGPPDPGYAKLRGLVLFEGGGGSTAGPAPSADTLDRIEARFDGGLFGAVRDDAPRCVDGTTPCTVASEAGDCAGQVPPVCTEPVPAYASVPGLINATLLAVSEVVAIQAATDPDSGQVILQVDQGAPGNNVLAVVPELSGLGFILPPATAFGATGSFVDDDGFPSSLAAFVRTSVGAPGPVLGGLLTWQEITEGPLPPEVLPDNGPRPTTLAEADSEWGQEQETLRLARVNEGFYRGGTNFTDWYYPSSGLSVTDGLPSLDSSALSLDPPAGRGRRDIENLIRAAEIDIPVIAFGGSNGLTPSPAEYVPFAQSLAPCAVPSCDGTPRVVDASLPNPAFPTLGGVNGGFEVYISEGLAHVDVVLAEDDRRSIIYGPLLDFLVRNAP